MMKSINLGFLRTPQSEPLAAALAMATGCVISTAQVTGLTGVEIAAECQKFCLDILVLGSPDPVPARAAMAGIPVIIFKEGRPLRAVFSDSGMRIEFEEYNIPQDARFFCLRQKTEELESTLIPGDKSPTDVLAMLEQAEHAVLVLPEAVPSIYDAQQAGVRCVAATSSGIVEVMVTVNEDPFEIQIVTKPFVP